ncbi:MAG: hypothetical protein H6841_05110 [Planctomycetes bacterium]|nr:hypothetical protein [Planctomycetota bacterium]MCB9934994.1 hypothetical protein [Planctomycetota bacterium]
MAKLTRGGIVLPLLLLIVAGLFAAGLPAQDPEPPADEKFEPDPNEPITVDFVQKDLHTVMHYIALRSGLQIIVEGEVNVKLTVMFRNVKPKDAIQSICKANKLDYIEDGEVIIIKRRPQEEALANVVKGEEEGRFNVNFESHELVAAIMEVASVTKAQVLVPAVPPSDQQQAPPRGEEEQQQEQRVTRIQERKISIYMREAKPEVILERLAALGDLSFTEVPVKDAVAGTEIAYQFTYKDVRAEDIGQKDPTKPITSKSWVIPGADMAKLKTELQNLLSPAGKLVTDDATDFVMVYDYEDYVKRFSDFLDPLVEKSAALQMQLSSTADKLVVREYRMTRNASDQAMLTQVQGVLSENGRVITNPDRNSIVVYELESRIKDVDTIMTALDTAPEQVLITAKLIEVGLDDYMGYGLELFTSHSADNLNNGRFTGGSQDTTSGTVGGLFGQPTGFDPFFATFTNPRIDIRLELLANEGRVETLSQPTQMVSNRQKARIEVGQEIPYLESSGASGGTTTASVSFKEVSIVMEVTPTVLENGLIRLEVIVTVREVIGNVAIEGNNTPVLSKRESKTDVFIRDGETLVMGGLIRERERMDENGLPFLKDIPFLGYLFKSANRTTSKTDLLFFLRPQIVNVVKGAEISETGEAVERDLRPLIYEEGDQKTAKIRDGRYRKLEIAPKPNHYNEKARPKTGAEVKPGA